jgi:subtilisin family serine protease
LLLVIGLLLVSVAATLAQGADLPALQRGERAAVTRTLPASVSDLKLNQPLTADATTLLNGLNQSLVGTSGTQRVVVRLRQPVNGATGDALAASISTQQDGIVANARSLDSNARVLGTLKLALNAVIMEIDASALGALAANPNVLSVNPVVDYELDLSETVPYIGATAVQDLGYDGTGVKVAVLDSGIDYLHAALGGSGDPAEYAANDPTIIEPGSFPTAKVVGGTDFVGSAWVGGAGSPPEAPDPDPLDDGPGAGHGTHVSHIIGGVGGVAPGVDLYAVKVCSSVSTSCSGVALLNAMEFILDPNGDSDTSDRMDIINMSLGSPLGNPVVDDLSFAVENVSAQGVLVVTSSGNSSDKPYVTGTPGAAPSALSVAQTNVPSATQDIMDVLAPPSIAGQYPAVFQPWSAPLTERIEGPLQYGDGSGGNLDGCAPFPAGSLTGMIVLVDRGACNFTLKIKNIAEGGGLVGIIGLIAPGDPFQGGDGGDRPINIPGYMISQGVADILREGLDEGTVTIAFDPANGIPLVGVVVGSSSRGPSVELNQIKPEIGAPGASVSAIAGTGTEEGPFGGTSGAAPMVTGSAALLMQAYPDRNWAEIKAVLVNNGETNIFNDVPEFGGELAPITRIGGGEVRVDDAFHSELAAWENNTLSSTLSWGFHEVTDLLDLTKRVVVRNYSNRTILLRTEAEFRFANDADSGVSASAPTYFAVPGGKSVTVPVHLFIRPRVDTPLHDWAMNSGADGANPAALTFNEYDGYLYFIEVGNPENRIHVPMQVLPRSSGDVEVNVQQNGFASVRNVGKGTAFIDTYSLIGTSPDKEDPTPGSNAQLPDLRYVGVQTYPVPAGFCGPNDSFLMGFAVNTWERQTHANVTSFLFYLDTNNDGTDDYIVLNRDVTLNNITDGRNLTWVVDLATGNATAFFFTQHFTNAANTALYFCGDQIGMDASDFLTTSMSVDVEAQDFYFGGESDFILDLNVVPLGERYFTIFQNGDIAFTVLPPRSDKLGFFIIDFGQQLNTTETGVLWLYGPGEPEGNGTEVFIFQQP